MSGQRQKNHLERQGRVPSSNLRRDALTQVAMNRIDSFLPPQREAKLRYLDHDFEVVREGEFVRCAVTGDPIRHENLRYWSIEKQVPFKSARESFADYVSAIRSNDQG